MTAFALENDMFVLLPPSCFGSLHTWLVLVGLHCLPTTLLVVPVVKLSRLLYKFKDLMNPKRGLLEAPGRLKEEGALGVVKELWILSRAPTFLLLPSLFGGLFLS